MFCRALRDFSARCWALAGLLCLALALGTAAATRVSFEEHGATSIGLRAPEFPLAALATTSGVRFEKQGQAVRLTLHKPQRSAHLSSIERSCGVLSRPRACHAFTLLPRRFLHPRDVTPRAPSDAGDPFLASLSLS
jgi:hypothetical protein